MLARQFASPLIYALLIAAVVAFALGDLADGAVVLGVVVLNALIGFVQEYRAGRAIEALAQLVSEPATVLRNKRWTQVDAADLVPGDVVSIEAGARVAADLRVLQAHGLRVDESTLTGESVPVDKSAAPVGPAADLAERRSMLHGGSLVTTGSAVAAVVETGDRTELGRISGLLGGIEKTQTPLTLGIARLGSTITKIIGVVAVILLGVALLRGFPVGDAALAAITLAVAAIPEGLPAIVTIALAVGVQRMARRRAVVRELPAVETLGSTSVVCTDKTGTLRDRHPEQQAEHPVVDGLVAAARERPEPEREREPRHDDVTDEVADPESPALGEQPVQLRRRGEQVRDDRREYRQQHHGDEHLLEAGEADDGEPRGEQGRDDDPERGHPSPALGREPRREQPVPCRRARHLGHDQRPADEGAEPGDNGRDGHRRARPLTAEDRVCRVAERCRRSDNVVVRHGAEDRDRAKDVDRT